MDDRDKGSSEPIDMAEQAQRHELRGLISLARRDVDRAEHLVLIIRTNGAWIVAGVFLVGLNAGVLFAKWWWAL